MILNRAVYRYSSPHFVARHILYEHVVYVPYSSLIHPPALVVCLTSDAALFSVHTQICVPSVFSTLCCSTRPPDTLAGVRGKKIKIVIINPMIYVYHYDQIDTVDVFIGSQNFSTCDCSKLSLI